MIVIAVTDLKTMKFPAVCEILMIVVGGVHLFLPKVQSFASVCNHWFTMTSADFSPFVVTDGFHTLFLSADETSLGTTRFFLSNS